MACAKQLAYILFYLSPKGPVVTTDIISIFLKRRQRLREIKKLDKIILLVNEWIQS